MKKEKLSDIYPKIRKFYQQLKENMSEEELAGTELYKFMIYRIMQEYRVNTEGKFIKGKTHYDIQTALKENAFISYFYKGRPKALADMLCKIKKQIEKGYILILEPKNHPKGYIRIIEILGNIKKESKRNFNNFVEEITDLVLQGKNIKDHSRRLQRDYNVKKEIIEGSEKPNEEYEGLWDWISKEYKGMTKEEISKLRDDRKFFNEQPLKEEKTQEPQGQDITEEEYKKRFGHYPDLGKNNKKN